jgi:hypothetical protein
MRCSEKAHSCFRQKELRYTGQGSACEGHKRMTGNIAYRFGGISQKSARLLGGLSPLFSASWAEDVLGAGNLVSVRFLCL